MSSDPERLTLFSDGHPQFNVILFSETPQIAHLNEQYYYRYLSPTKNKKGLDAFYGEDRSFCRGQFFDESDFLIEFIFVKKTFITAIPHHPFSYRGELNPENVKILALYYKNPPNDFCVNFFRTQFKSIAKNVAPQTFFYEVYSYPSLRTAEIYSISQKN
jgi:hypothetical protein